MNEITEEIVKEWGRKAMSYFREQVSNFSYSLHFVRPLILYTFLEPRHFLSAKHIMESMTARKPPQRPQNALPQQGRHFSEANPIRLSDAKNRPEPTGICKQSFWRSVKKKPPAKAGGLKTCNKKNSFQMMFRRPGSDLLSRALRQSTMGAKGFNVRVRNGIGWDTFAITTRSSKHHLKELEPNLWSRLFIR